MPATLQFPQLAECRQAHYCASLRLENLTLRGALHALSGLGASLRAKRSGGVAHSGDQHPRGILHTPRATTPKGAFRERPSDEPASLLAMDRLSCCSNCSG